MERKITLCGDDCLACPRYNASAPEALSQVAELWHRIGWRASIVPAEEMRCTGCDAHKSCTYQLVECTKAHQVAKCNQCSHFPCDKIQVLLQRSAQYQARCKSICTADEYAALEQAFFHKEQNLLL